ncbi:endoglucanase A-like [Mercenaria mercenaria]|uniref:endoglucanase A-like n=1 Tax=Mercenaria mercenaria TaxID=6596 RepID=UPI00234E7B75|nr:endoglucanase A-like [Mercenaria mercenaria]
MWILLPLALVGSALGATPLTITNHWYGGFEGDFTVQGEAHNWKVHLVFDHPINKLEVWKVTVESHTNGGKEFVLRAIPAYANIAAGASLKCHFVARQNGDQVPSGTFNMEGANGGGGSSTGGGTSSGSGTSSGGGGTSSGSGTQLSGGSGTKYNYQEALKLSILFYDAQRSGRLPANNPISWRQDSAVNDGADGHDLSGGWYDAGDHVKFGLPMAWSAWVLLYGMLEFRDGYEAAGQKDMACDMIRTPLEYFLKCWIPDQQTLYVQVGDGYADHGFWGRPEDMHMGRPAYKVTTSCHGSDVAGDTAAAMAAGYLVFKDMCGDTGFADRLLGASKSLYTFAKNNRGKYTDCVTQAKDFYGSTGEADELSVAGAWLYKATNDQSYLNDAKGFYPAGTAWSFNWNDANVGAALLLYGITKDGKYKTDIEGLVNSFRPGGNVQKTPCGLAWRDQWGPNRHAGNVAFVATMAAKYGIQPDAYNKWAMSQINYLLGDNKLHISYEIGYGSNYPKRPHHRGSSCAPGWCAQGDQANPNILKGGLVGGPDQWDNYDDRRDDYVKNEVACDYNAGFQSALAGLVHFAHNGNLPAAPAAKC